VICITYSHYDHLSGEDIEKIRKPSTVIVGPADCRGGFGAAFKTVAPGDKVTVGDVAIEAVPAYNTDKDFHPKKKGWLGFVVSVDGVRVYHVGDSDVIPEMSGVKADVALVPVGGTYTMTVKQAAEAVSKINPKVAVPMHCGDIVGTLGDRETFKASCKTAVVILDITK